MTLDDYSPEEKDRDATCLWLGIELHIPDKEDQHNPQEMEDDLREWTHTFLSEGLANIDYNKTGEGVDLIPREDSFDENPLFIRYKSEGWFDDPESSIGRQRSFDVWFPITDFAEHHEFDVLKEKYTYLIGDEVYETYGEEIDVRGILLAGSEKSVRDHMNKGMSVDIDFDDYT